MFRHRAKTQNSNLAYSTKPFFLPFPALTLRRKILRYPLKDFISESIRFERLELFERLERFERLVEVRRQHPALNILRLCNILRCLWLVV